VSYAEGEALAASIIGIDRALDALRGLDAPAPETEAKRQEAADRKRWMSFLKRRSDGTVQAGHAVGRGSNSP